MTAPLLSQVDLPPMKGPDGEWSIIAMLLIAFAGVLAGLLFLFRVRDSERSAQFEELKARMQHLEQKSDECEQDRLSLHIKIAMLTAQLEDLRVNKHDIRHD